MGNGMVFDIETDGLDATKVWCIVTQDLDTGEQRDYTGAKIAEGLRALDECPILWGHNIANFDLPVLRRLYGYTPIVGQRIIDTLCASRQVYPGKELAKKDFILIRRGVMPHKATEKPHSLEAWGYRLGHPKSSMDDFSAFNTAMLDYCKNDVALNAKLVLHLLKRTEGSTSVFETETELQRVLRTMQDTGVGFNVEEAVALSARLAARREELQGELRRVFPPWYAKKGKPTVPKIDRPKQGVAAGCEYQNIQLVEFNPASGQHIARALKLRYGWEPHDFTESGLPKTEEKVLADLPWPECKLLVEYQRLKKILGYISEGDNAWLQLERKGSIHGRMHATGTVTNRGSHVEPNLGQVPKVGKPFGKECRALFVARPGYRLVGADASGLQLRMLAHYLAPFDARRFALLIENGGDVHSYMQEGTGMIRRDNSKTGHYAWLFGAGAYKMGTIAIFDFANAKELGLWDGEVPPLKRAVAIGNRVKAGLEAKLQMKGLAANLKRAAQRGYLRSLDGRHVPVLSQHKALNTLLMAGEAVVMKHATLKLAPQLSLYGARLVLWVHDEWQVEAPAETADLVGAAMVDCIKRTGEMFNLKVRLDGAYKVGDNWSETH